MKKRLTHILLSLYLLTLPISCERELSLPEVGGKKKIALLGELVANEPLYFRAGQSIPLVKGSQLQFDFIKDLIVTAKDNWGDNYYFSPAKDSLSDKLLTVAYNAIGNVKPSTVYELKANHPEMGVATCTVDIPTAFGSMILDTSTTIFAGSDLFKVRVQISDISQVENFYSIEALKQYMYLDSFFFFEGSLVSIKDHRKVYDSLLNAGNKPTLSIDTQYSQTFTRLGVYTDDPNSENLILGNPLNVNKRILLQDKDFDGSSYFSNLYVDKTYFSSRDIAYRGRIVIVVKSLSKDYFHFLKGYEQYDAQSGLNSFNKPIEIQGNIANGVGMIGGVYQIRFYYCFDKW